MAVQGQSRLLSPLCSPGCAALLPPSRSAQWGPEGRKKPVCPLLRGSRSLGSARPGPSSGSPSLWRDKMAGPRRGQGGGAPLHPRCCLWGAASWRCGRTAGGGPCHTDPGSSAAVSAQTGPSARGAQSFPAWQLRRENSPSSLSVELRYTSELHLPAGAFITSDPLCCCVDYCAFYQQQDSSRGTGTTGSACWFCVVLWDLLCSSLPFLCCFFHKEGALGVYI